MYGGRIARNVRSLVQRAWDSLRHPIRSGVTAPATDVDRYWTRHTVNSKPFESAEQSAAYLEWRFSEYPLFREFMDLWGSHDGHVILDYGCGPGDDTTGFLIHTKAAKVVAMDISKTALRLTSSRLGRHGVPAERVQLVHLADARPSVAAETASIDYVHSGGVLHHTSDPLGILREFHRILKPGGTARIMVYNRESLWFHLFTAYERRVIECKWPGVSIEEAFTRNTDGEECPIARCYSSGEFLELVQDAGFTGEYVGGYLSKTEIESWRKHGAAALDDARLDSSHREFLRSLTFDAAGFPLHQGKHAGIGGCFRLTRRA